MRRLSERAYARKGLRNLARGIVLLQESEAQRIHAERDQCLVCLLGSAAALHLGCRLVPLALRRDEEWLHRRVLMPAARKLARIDDEWRQEAHDG